MGLSRQATALVQLANSQQTKNCTEENKIRKHKKTNPGTSKLALVKKNPKPLNVNK